ncbi:nucleobase:cation symporter-2 family protein [Pendulispora albinea]|uniref:Purine permease n=1 Tax=Pendulispora albinea TaxID=2741071 RepID=A0ABZ2M9N6_9BACT
MQAHDARVLHPVDEMLPFGALFLYGLQHVLAMYAGAVAVPLILSNAIGLTHEQTIYLINADLFTCGIATLIQTLGLWKLPIGMKIPLIQGCTFVAVTPMILIGKEHGLPAIYGSILVAGTATVFLSPYMGKLLAFFPPVVSGTIITIVGVSLLPVAVNWAAGGNPHAPDYGDPRYAVLAFVVLVFILLIYRFASGFIANIAVMLGLVFGTLVSIPLGFTHFAKVADAGWLGITTPFKYGWPTFQVSAILSMLLVMLITMTETTGSMLAAGEIVGKPVSKDDLTRGLRADGFSTVIGGILNAFPYTAFSQNIGLLGLTGVKSRFAVSAAGVILMVLGLFPKLAAVVAAIPTPVLGGAGLALFGMVGASGIQMLVKVDFRSGHNLMVIALSLGFGLIPLGNPHFYDKFPSWLQLILHSGITAGSIAAIVLNLFLNGVKPAAMETRALAADPSNAE